MKITDYSRSTPGLWLGTAASANAVAGMQVNQSIAAQAGWVPVATSSNAFAWRDALSFGSNTNDVSSVGTMGSSPSNTRADHVHRGVHSITAAGSNTLYGDVTLVAGTNMGINVAGQSITFDSSATGGASIGSNSTDVSGSTALGGLTTYAPSTHLHRGVHSLSHTSNTFYGDVTLVAGSGVGITSPVSGSFALSSTGGGGGGGGASDLDTILAASSGQDIADALSGAAAPDAGNVFATMADVGSELLGIVTYAGSSGDTTFTTTSTTFVDVSAANVVVTFTAPASGNVLIRVYCPGIAVNGSGVFFHVRESTTNIGMGTLAGASAAIVPAYFPLYITGISAGSHTYKLGWHTDGGITATLYYGNTARGPVVMEVWSA